MLSCLFLKHYTLTEGLKQSKKNLRTEELSIKTHTITKTQKLPTSWDTFLLRAYSCWGSLKYWRGRDVHSKTSKTVMHELKCGMRNSHSNPCAHCACLCTCAVPMKIYRDSMSDTCLICKCANCCAPKGWPHIVCTCFLQKVGNKSLFIFKYTTWTVIIEYLILRLSIFIKI